MTMSCIWMDLENQIVLRVSCFIRARNVRSVRAIFCVWRVPGWC